MCGDSRQHVMISLPCNGPPRASASCFPRCFKPTVADVATVGGVEKIIESCAAYGHGQRMYHASTRGFIVGGLVRHITGGTTLGHFIKDNIVEPLGLTLLTGATFVREVAQAPSWCGAKAARESVCQRASRSNG